MAYLVNLTARAERDLALMYLQINAEDSDAALIWYSGFKEAILSLEQQPMRCPVTPESDNFRHFAVRKKAAYLPRNIPRAGKAKAG
jgi:hypothetical protein